MAFLWLRIPGGKRAQESLEEREILLQPIKSPAPKQELLGLAQLQGKKSDPIQDPTTPIPGGNFLQKTKPEPAPNLGSSGKNLDYSFSGDGQKTHSKFPTNNTQLQVKGRLKE